VAASGGASSPGQEQVTRFTFGGGSWDPFAADAAAPSDQSALGVGFPGDVPSAGFPKAGVLGAEQAALGETSQVASLTGGGGFGGGAGFLESGLGVSSARETSLDSDAFYSPLGADEEGRDVPASAPVFRAHGVHTDLIGGDDTPAPAAAQRSAFGGHDAPAAAVRSALGAADGVNPEPGLKLTPQPPALNPTRPNPEP